jgi:hypothetical protein
MTKRRRGPKRRPPSPPPGRRPPVRGLRDEGELLIMPAPVADLRVTDDEQPASPGCSAAWSARLLWEQDVGGSNPLTPTHQPALGPASFVLGRDDLPRLGPRPPGRAARTVRRTVRIQHGRQSPGPPRTMSGARCRVVSGQTCRSAAAGLEHAFAPVARGFVGDAWRSAWAIDGSRERGLTGWA